MKLYEVLAPVGAALLISATSAPAWSAAAKPVAPAARRASAPAYKTSLEHYQALKKQAGGGARKTWATLPDWSGIWERETPDAFDPTVKAGAPQTAPLNAAAAAAYRKVRADRAAGKDWDSMAACLPAGYPRSLSVPFYREFVVRPEQVWWMNEMVNEYRRIYLDGRDHPPEDEIYPLWDGHSIGFWTGDTLVIHTVALRVGEYNLYGPRHGEQTSTVEQVRKIDADTIEDRITVYDPENLTRPWNVTMRFKRVHKADARIQHWSCQEGRNFVQKDGAVHIILPGEDGYREPSSIGQPEGYSAEK